MGLLKRNTQTRQLLSIFLRSTVGLTLLLTLLSCNPMGNQEDAPSLFGPGAEGGTVQIEEELILSTIADQAFNENSSTRKIPFSIIHGANTLDCEDNVKAFSSNQDIISNSNILIEGEAPNCTVQFSSLPEMYGTVTINLVVASKAQTRSEIIIVTVNKINEPPAISSIQDQTAIENTRLLPINFTIMDEDNDLNCANNISVESSDQTILNISSIAISGTAPNCIATITNNNKVGTTNLTFSVSDGEHLVSQTFVLEVISGIQISNINNQSINEDTASHEIQFTIEHPGQNLNCITNTTVASSNQDLLPNNNLIISGDAPNCILTINPAANNHGSSDLTITLNSNSQSTSEGFSVEVQPVNDSPIISSITSNETPRNTQSSPISFTISDIDSVLNCNSLTGLSSDETIIKSENMAFTGTAPNCQVTITPEQDASGLANLTISVSDGHATSESSFQFNVLGPFTVTPSSGEAAVGTPISFSIENGTAPYQITTSGVAVSVDTNASSVTPSQSGQLNVTVSDSAGNSESFYFTAYEVISEDITEDTTWSGYIKVPQSIVIGGSSKTLTVGPGTIILFDSPTNEPITLNLNGGNRLKMNGTQNSPITIKSATETTASFTSAWYPKEFTLNHVNMTNIGSSSISAIDNIRPGWGATISIENSTFENCGKLDMTLYSNDSNLTFSNNEIKSSLSSNEVIKISSGYTRTLR